MASPLELNSIFKKFFFRKNKCIESAYLVACPCRRTSAIPISQYHGLTCYFAQRAGHYIARFGTCKVAKNAPCSTPFRPFGCSAKHAGNALLVPLGKKSSQFYFSGGSAAVKVKIMFNQVVSSAQIPGSVFYHLGVYVSFNPCSNQFTFKAFGFFASLRGSLAVRLYKAGF